MQSEDSQGERQERVAALTARRAGLNEVRTKIRRLNVALANLAVAEVNQQLSLIRVATRYVDAIEHPPTGVRPLLAMISNELQSLREGITARVVKPKDLVLTAGVRAIKSIDDLIEKATSNIAKIEAAIGDHGLGPDQAMILRNQKAKEKIPAFGGKDFVVARAPVAFTFLNKKNHSTIGYVDKEMLERLGFKSENLGGYTIIHNQLVIGIDSHAVYEKGDDDGEGSPPTLIRKRVKESVITFKGGKPTKVLRARDKSHLDVALKIKSMLESKAGQRYEFVSELSVGLNGGEFFWLMPSQDHSRFARAFGGGFAKVSKWGFAF